MTDLQILILTLFLGLFVLLINYLVKFFRSAVKSAEENQAIENVDKNQVNKQVRIFGRILVLDFPYLPDLGELFISD